MYVYMYVHAMDEKLFDNCDKFMYNNHMTEDLYHPLSSTCILGLQRFKGSESLKVQQPLKSKSSFGRFVAIVIKVKIQ